MKQMTITGFTPTFDFDHFEARHKVFARKVIQGGVGLEDAIEDACSSHYDPSTLYNTLQPLLAARNKDRKIVALRGGLCFVGIGAGSAAPYFSSDDPSYLVVCSTAFAGGFIAGVINLAFTNAPHDENPGQEYDLAYDHIGAVVSALEKRYELHKPYAEELDSGEEYRMYYERVVASTSTGKKVTSTRRFVLQDERNTLDFQIVNGVPEKIKISQIGGVLTEEVNFTYIRTPFHFNYNKLGSITFRSATFERYQAAIEPYGRLTVR